MIATGLPQEYVPCGRQHYEKQHPGEKFLCQTSNSHVENVDPHNINIVTALNNVSLQESLLKVST